MPPILPRMKKPATRGGQRTGNLSGGIKIFSRFTRGVAGELGTQEPAQSKARYRNVDDSQRVPPPFSLFVHASAALSISSLIVHTWSLNPLAIVSCWHDRSIAIALVATKTGRIRSRPDPSA